MQRPGITADEQASAADDGQKGGEVRQDGEHGGVRGEFFELFEQGLFAGRDAGGKDQFVARSGGSAMEFGPAGNRPFLFRLAGGDVTEDGGPGQKLFGDAGEGGVGTKFEFRGGGHGNVPGGQELQVAQGLVAAAGKDEGLGVTKAAAEKAAGPGRGQTLGGPAGEADEGAAVVAGEIDGAVEVLAAQGPKDGPGGREPGLAACPGEGPDLRKPREMTKERHDFLGDQDVQRGAGEMVFEGAQSRGHQGGVAQVTELNGKNLHRAAVAKSMFAGRPACKDGTQAGTSGFPFSGDELSSVA